MIVDEKTVLDILGRLEVQEDYAKELMDSMEEVYEDFLSYLEQEVLSILQGEEVNLLLFALSVLTEAFAQKGKKEEELDLATFFDLEEKMWALYEEHLKAPFRERLNPFYELIDEEEALAFVEDLLVDEEEEAEHAISSVGRDIIWNCCAAFVSLLSEETE